MTEEDCNLVTALEGESEEEDEHEEAPSLSDLPLTGEEHSTDRRRSMSEPADFFEFMMPNLDCSSYTFSWNDLVWPSISSTAADAHEESFFSDQRRPLMSSTPQQSPLPQSISLLLSPSSVVSAPRYMKTRRSESFNESKMATQYSSLLKSPCFRPSRSLDYCRLRRDPSSTRSRLIRTNSGIVDSSDRANSGGVGARAQPRSPPWYWLMFGPLRFPPAAETEIRRRAKSRQTRPPATLFPAGEKVSGERKGWKLISVLSCKSHASVAVTTPFQPYC